MSIDELIEQYASELLNVIGKSFNIIEITPSEGKIECNLFLVEGYDDSVLCMKNKSITIYPNGIHVDSEIIFRQMFINVPYTPVVIAGNFYIFDVNNIEFDENKFKSREIVITDESEWEDIEENDDDYPYWSGYMYLKNSYCKLWGYHNTDYLHWRKDPEAFIRQHPFGTKYPDLIHVKKTPLRDLRYPDLAGPDFIVPERKYRRRFTMFNPSIKLRRVLPKFGFEFVELSNELHVDGNYQGLFILSVVKNSVEANAGLIQGDVIHHVSRPKVKKTYEIRTKLELYDVLDRMDEKEKMTLVVSRSGRDFEITFKPLRETQIIQKFSILKPVGEPEPANYEIEDGDLYIWNKQYVRSSCADDNPFNDIVMEVDDDMFLHVSLPKAIKDTEFLIDNNGNLVYRYAE